MGRVFTITIETAPITRNIPRCFFQGDGFNVVIPIIIVAIIVVAGIVIVSIISRITAISNTRVVVAICATASRANANIPGSIGVA